MIKVWSDNLAAGHLGHHGTRGTAFAYTEDAVAGRAVSMTMPVRIASWDQTWGLHPIFEMNLPEGYLRERLRLGFAKATGTFGDLDLLAIVGRSQIGRLRYTGAEDALDEDVPFQSVDEILGSRRGGDLFAYMIERFAKYSGVAGVQPKILIRDEANSRTLNASSDRKSPSVRGATHIVKFWDPNEYPQLAANEFFCLLAAEKAGLTVPGRRLSDDGSALVVERFDLRPDGTYRGLEDFCVLNGKGTDRKYEGSVETALVKRTKDFISGDNLKGELAKLFTLLALNVAIRNGDAHLKNYAVTYDEVGGPARLADVYDLVTTTAYLPKDAMALTLDGSTRWPDRKQLLKLGTLRCGLTPKEATTILDRITAALVDALSEMQIYARANPEFAQIADRMASEWQVGAGD